MGRARGVNRTRTNAAAFARGEVTGRQATEVAHPLQGPNQPLGPFRPAHSLADIAGTPTQPTPAGRFGFLEPGAEIKPLAPQVTAPGTGETKATGKEYLDEMTASARERTKARAKERAAGPSDYAPGTGGLVIERDFAKEYGGGDPLASYKETVAADRKRIDEMIAAGAARRAASDDNQQVENLAAGDDAAIAAMFRGAQATDTPPMAQGDDLGQVTRPVETAGAVMRGEVASVKQLPPLREEFPEIASAGFKTGTKFVQFEKLAKLPLMEQVAWAVRWLESQADREADYNPRFAGKKKDWVGERGGLITRATKVLKKNPDSPGLLLIRGGLYLQSPDAKTKEKDTSAGLTDIAKGLSVVQAREGVPRAVQVFEALGEIPAIDQVRAELVAGLAKMPRFAELVAALDEASTLDTRMDDGSVALQGRTAQEAWRDEAASGLTFEQLVEEYAASRVNDAMSEMADVDGGADNTLNIANDLRSRMPEMTLDEVRSYGEIIDRRIPPDDEYSTGAVALEEMWDEAQQTADSAGLDPTRRTGHLDTDTGVLTDTTELTVVPEGEAEVAADEQRRIAEKAYEAMGNQASREEADAVGAEVGDAGAGGTVPPSGGTRTAGGFDGEDGSGESGGKPRSEIRKRIEKMIRAIQIRLEGGIFRLSGDDAKTGQHSAEVIEAIGYTLDFFNIDAGTDVEYRMAERFLFRSFMYYRGVGVDAKGYVFGKKEEDSVIYDQTFIQFLEEIRNNALTADKHPFKYSRPHKKLGKTESYPVPIDMATAEFFTQGREVDGNPIEMTAKEFLDFTYRQYHENTEPRLWKMAPDSQREAVFALYDAIAEKSDHPLANPRSPDARATLSELLRADSLYAQMFNSRAELADAQSERIESSLRATEKNEKYRKQKGESKADPLSPDDAVADPSGLFERMLEPNVTGALRMVKNIGRSMGVLFMPMIGTTGVAEGGTGVVIQSWATKLLKKTLRRPPTKEDPNPKAWDPTPRTKEFVGKETFFNAIGEVFDIISWKGMEGVRDAAAHEVVFGGKADAEGKVVSGQVPLIGKAAEATEGMLGAAMSWSTGDWAWSRARAQVFIENYIYRLEKSHREGGLTITPQQIENALISNQNDFLRSVIETPEGRAALLHAVNTSLGGIDPLTETLRRATRNDLVDTALGFTVGWYLKFGIRSPLRMIPFSNTAIFAIKRGMINPAMVHSGLKTAEQVRDSNESMFGMNDQFADGFFQNAIIDLSRFGTQVGTYTFVYGLVSLLGGLEPPDDEDKDHLWYEYKIGGRAFKENWYWLEILGFAMPFAVAMHVGGTTGDMGKVKQIMFNGTWEKLQESPWDNVTDYADLINNFDQKLIEAQATSEGYKEQHAVSKDEFIFTQFMSMLGRRGYQTFEPAIVRAFYNERGLGRGANDLARSPNVVYTPDPDDGDATEMTTWQDSQKRRMAMSSPGMGKLLNLISGYNAVNPEIQETGYLRKEMPLIANVDPTNMMWVTELSVQDADGNFIPGDQWSDEEIRVRVQTVLDLLDKKLPSELAANGVVIPYDARGYTMAELNRQWREARDEHDETMESGGFNYKALGIAFEESRKLQNDSWNKVEEKRDAINELKEMLFSDEIPYSAMKYNRWETNYRTIYRWKEGTPKAGRPATALDYRIYGSKIDVEWYPSGDHKSGFLPWLSVDDQGKNTYDAQAPVGWQTDATDMDFVRSTTEGKTIPQGMFEGQDLWGTLSGSGAVGPGPVAEGSWDKDQLLFGARAYQNARVPSKKLDRNDFKVSDDDKKKATPTTSDSSGGFRSWPRRSWGSGGGGGSYNPKVYSNPAHGLNANKPAGLFRRSPQRTRYDFLRPSVKTKGSREAYRREDI